MTGWGTPKANKFVAALAATPNRSVLAGAPS
jgi:hypothetical protein